MSLAYSGYGTTVQDTGRGASATMHHDKDNKQKQGDQRQMNQGRDRDLKGQRNEEETGKPIQLDKDGKENQGGQHQQGGQEHQGGQHQQGGQQRPQERKPEQGQPTTHRP